MAGGTLRIESVNSSVSVSLTETASGNVTQLYSDGACTATVAQPVTVASNVPALLYVVNGGAYTLSVKASGVEIAGGYGVTRPVVIDHGEFLGVRYIPSREGLPDAGVYTPSGMPAFAGARTKRYDQSVVAYNVKPSNTLTLRAAAQGALSGLRYSNILMIGDSKTAGFGVNAGGQYIPARALPGQMATALAGQGFSVGTGWVYPYHNLSVTDDARFVYTGTWTAKNASSRNLYASSTATGTVTFTSDRTGTVAEFQYLPTSTAFTYQIDGGTAVPVTPSGSGTTPVTVTVTGLANTTHTIAINATGSGVLIQAFQVRPATGIGIANAGLSGSTATDWVQQNATPAGVGNVVTPAPDAVFIQLGVNDCRTTIALATFTANLAGIVSRFRVALGKSTVLIVPSPPQLSDTPAAKWQTYVSAIYDVADTYDVPVLDFNESLVDWATANTAGLMFDSLHENDIGYATQARNALFLLTV